MLEADTVLAGCTPYHAFLELLPGLCDGGASPLPTDFVNHLRHADYSCGAFKVAHAPAGRLTSVRGLAEEARGRLPLGWTLWRL